MATEHDPSALDAPIQPGGVPRHASAKERKGRGLKPFLSDLKAEVQNQLSRAEPPVRTGDPHGQATQVVYPAAQAQQIEAPETYPQQPDSSAALACRPQLTTIRQPVEEMAAEMVRLLLAHIREPGQLPRSVIFQPTLVVRQSA